MRRKTEQVLLREKIITGCPFWAIRGNIFDKYCTIKLQARAIYSPLLHNIPLPAHVHKPLLVMQGENVRILLNIFKSIHVYTMYMYMLVERSV